MPRGERPLGPGDEVVVGFASGLRQLRQEAGGVTYRQLGVRAHYSPAALSEAAGGRRLPSLAVTLAYVAACGGDRAEWEKRWREAAARINAATSDENDDEGRVRAPYVGLAAFQPDDADRFFGREALVAELVAGVRRRRFLGVFGPSGSGKSSVLRAGLIPAVTRGNGTGSRSCPVVVLTPGPRPVEECAVRLAPFTGVSAAVLREEFAADPGNVHVRIRQVMADHPADVALVLVVDQFEELFTVCTDEAQREWFITALVTAAHAETSRTRVVLGTRADFFGHCGRYPDLVDALRDAQVLVGPMTAEELRQAITGPAERIGCRVETALVSQLIADATGQPGVLPLLSHALLQTWRRRHGTLLTLTGYHSTGGIPDALARTAEDLYTALDSRQQDLLRQVFLRLAALGDGTEDTKRHAHRHEFDSTNGDMSVVLDQLARARLVTLDQDTITLTHEALLRHWPRLGQWLAEDRDGLRVHRHLTDATHAWNSLDQDPGALYRGIRLTHAQDWATSQPDTLSTAERLFLEHSTAAQHREHTSTRRRTRWRRAAVITLVTLLVAAGVATTIAATNARDARHNHDLALSRQLASQSDVLSRTDPTLAQRLAVAAWHIAPTPEAHYSMINLLTRPQRSILIGHTEPVLSVAYSPDGNTLATAGTDGTIRLWDAHTNRQIGEPLPGRIGESDVAFSPDGTTLATSGDDETVRLWDVKSHQQTGTLLTGHNVIGSTVVFSPDGQTLATASWDRTVRLWDLTTRQQIGAPLTGDIGQGADVAFSPDGQTLVTASERGTARLWDVRTQQQIGDPFAGNGDLVLTVAFGHDGPILATTSVEGVVRLWDIRTRQQIGEPLTGHRGWVADLAFSPDGRTIATTGQDHTARLWDARSHQQIGDPLIGHINGVLGLAFSPDGQTLATTSGDHTTRIWNLLTHRQIRDPLAEAGKAKSAPDGKPSATAGYDRTKRWLRDLATNKNLGEPFTGRSDTQVTLNPNGKTVIFEGENQPMPLWDLTIHRRTGESISRTDTVPVVFGPDGKILITANGDNSVVWDIHAHRSIDSPFVDPDKGIHGLSQRLNVAFSPNGKTIAASASYDRIILLWDLQTRRQIGKPLTGHTDPILDMTFSPDGATIATASNDRTVRLWNVDTQQQIGEPFTGHSDEVRKVVFSPDGNTIATASIDQTLRLWDIGTHQQIGEPLIGHNGSLSAIAFSPDGNILAATAFDDHTVRLWNTSLHQDPKSALCAQTGPLTQQEWSRFAPDEPMPQICT